MNLPLARPLVFIDLETTGLNVATDRIVEICAVKILPNGGGRRILENRVNPGIPIPPGTTKFHGITDEDIANCPTFTELAAEYWQFLDGCDLGGYNVIKYDLPLLRNEFIRVGQVTDQWQPEVIDVGNIFRTMESRNLTAAVRFYCDADHTGSHAARADIEATIAVFEAQLIRYPNLPRTVSELAKFCQR